MATNKSTARQNQSNIGEDLHEFPFPIRKNNVKDDYEISTEGLGIGINGTVFKCRNRRTGENCALKTLKDSVRTRREIILHYKACQNCQYIVQIRDVYIDTSRRNRSFSIIMECMEGGEFFNRIQEREENPYTERDAAHFISMIVKAVAHLHSMDIAHRDLKPENLLFTSKEKDAILKLSDFGFAKEAQPLTTPWCYTPYYVAPEILSATIYDKACDIWSMGVIMYILLCGKPPFYAYDGSNMSSGMKGRILAGEYQFNEEPWKYVSEEAKLTIKQMLTVNPTERITIDEIVNCSWLNKPTSARPIDITPLLDVDNWNQIQSELASANDIQRRIDDDDALEITIRGPEASRHAKRCHAKERKAENK